MNNNLIAIMRSICVLCFVLFYFFSPSTYIICNSIFSCCKLHCATLSFNFLFQIIKRVNICSSPLQKLRVGLRPCKINLSPQVFILLIVPRRYFYCGSYWFMFCCLIFVSIAPYCAFSYIQLSSGNTLLSPIGNI